MSGTIYLIERFEKQRDEAREEAERLRKLVGEMAEWLLIAKSKANDLDKWERGEINSLLSRGDAATKKEGKTDGND